MLKTFNEIDFEKRNGLIPVVVQDMHTKDILMLAYVNQNALYKTMDTGNACFWSKSRNKMWMKGQEIWKYTTCKKNFSRL